MSDVIELIFKYTKDRYNNVIIQGDNVEQSDLNTIANALSKTRKYNFPQNPSLSQIFDEYIRLNSSTAYLPITCCGSIYDMTDNEENREIVRHDSYFDSTLTLGFDNYCPFLIQITLILYKKVNSSELFIDL